MTQFVKFVLAPAGLRGSSLPVSACRAGGIGIVNAELAPDVCIVAREVAFVAAHVRTPFGVKLESLSPALADILLPFAGQRLGWLIVDFESLATQLAAAQEFRRAGVKLLAEVRTPPLATGGLEDALDGYVIKGNEAGGYVGEDNSFILLQKWLGRTRLPGRPC